VLPVRQYLKRKNKYYKTEGPFDKSIIGALYSSGLFTKQEGNVWSINYEKAIEFESSQAKKLVSEGANNDQSLVAKLQEQDILIDNPVANEPQSVSEAVETKKPEAETATFGKRKRDLLDKFENMYQLLGGSENIENPFDDLAPGEDISQLLERLGKEKMLGILHAFVLLRPVIKDSIEREEQRAVEAEITQTNHESKVISDMATKVEYLNSVVNSVFSRVNQPSP